MQFEEMKQALISAAERANIRDYEIYYQLEESVSAETLKDEISAFASSTGGGVCFRCIVDGKVGYASGEQMTEEAMEDLVFRALSNARCIDSDDEAFLFPGSPEYATLPPRSIELADAATVRKTALDLQKATYAQSEKVGDGTQSAAYSQTSEIVICNSKGLNLSNRVGVDIAYVGPVCRDGEDAQEDFAFGIGKTYEELRHLPAKAVQGALDKMGAGQIPTGRYDVLIGGEAFRMFLSAFSPAFSAKNAQLGLSKLAGKEGTAVASPIVSLVDDPMREESPIQTPFDGEGVATARRPVIENGILKTLLYDLTTAKKAGLSSTGNGQKSGYSSPVSISPYHFSICAGDADREELLRMIGNGVLITECKGFHAGANAVTGDFSIESSGFMIRNGKRAEPVKSFTIAGNFFDLLQKIERLGSAIDWSLPHGFTAYGSPDILVRDISLAGT